MSADMGVGQAFHNTAAKIQAARDATRSITRAEYDSIIGDSVTVAAQGNDTQKIAYARLLYAAVDDAKGISDVAKSNLEAIELYFRVSCKPLLDNVGSFMPTPHSNDGAASAVLDEASLDIIPGSPAP